MITVYLIGQPGSGKTTLMNHILDRAPITEYRQKPVKHLTHAYKTHQAVSLGWPKTPFGGTDTLGFNAITPIKQQLLPIINQHTSILFAEGDRLANTTFFDETTKYGKLILFHLNTPALLAQQRRQQRAQQHQLKLQNPTWLAGRITKANNLVTKYNPIDLDGNQPMHELAQHVWQHIDSLLQ